jgi:VIT1/CCC1 family predicted Fe2+/Mn2+ transporter
MSSIVGVSRLIGVLMVVIPFANVTNAVVVSILVSFAILGIYVTVTGRKEIVVSFVV